MQQKLLTLLIFTLAVNSVRAQELLEPNKPYTILNTAPGYITINEITCGFSLKDVSFPDPKSFIGFTTIQGYQINRSFIIGAGTGALFYDSGTLIPLFLDIRCRLNLNPFTGYLFGEGGLLFNTKATTMLFIDPGIGVRYAITNKLGIDLGTGLLVASGSSLWIPLSPSGLELPSSHSDQQPGSEPLNAV